MPVIYASTKKGRLESWLKKQPSWMTKAKIRQNFCADTEIEISSSSVSAAIEEWQMNNYVMQQGDQFCWTWNKRGTTMTMKECWRPIATAPKDGTKVLLFWAEIPAQCRGSIEVGAWNDDRYASRKPRPYWLGTRLHDVLNYRANPPSHWQPLVGPWQ